MGEKELVIICKECGKEFTISEEEFAWYKEKGFDAPKRCKECRQIRRRARRDK